MQIVVLISAAGAAENTKQGYVGEDAARNQSYFEIQNVIDKHFADEDKAQKARYGKPETAKTEKTKPVESSDVLSKITPKGSVKPKVTDLTSKPAEKVEAETKRPQVELITEKKPKEVDLRTFRGFRKRRAVDKKVDFYTGIVPRSSNRNLTNFISDPNAPRQPVTIPFEGPIQAYQWKSFQKKWNYSRFQTNLYGKRLYISYKNKYNFPGPFNPGSRLAVEVVKVNREKSEPLPAAGLKAKKQMSNKDLSQQKAQITEFYLRGQTQDGQESDSSDPAVQSTQATTSGGAQGQEESSGESSGTSTQSSSPGSEDIQG
ncbi:hypothetical protein P0136_02695 [Lentisphaerota bacterium ZTH]|nr:hypothetical protein P0136_02695 [Lentisphaerota bacterium ZTH]